ncbi:hypothetical protein PT7_2240 [Pusillimonas sp. T7-7]|nr:hypothetical protein PT7_2240 [Pusillimonas sp. T7-7]
MPVLSEPGVWAEIIEAVSQAFQEERPTFLGQHKEVRY